MKICKICFFVPFYPVIKGGAEYQSKIIATELVKRGHQVFYISEGHDEKGIFFEEGFKVYLIKADSTFYEKASQYKKFMGNVLNIIEKEAPDVIYQRILNSFTLRLSDYAHQIRKPFLLHIADNYSVEFSNNFPKGFLKKKIFRKILANAPIVICQTEYQRLKVQAMGCNPAAVIHNMHPVITRSILEKNKKNILWIGNVRPVKQLEMYLTLAKEFKKTDFVFHVIGTLPQSMYGESLLTEIKRNENVVYHGSKDNGFINLFLRKSGVLVNTSISEGFSNTFVQSWMCGTPVLAFNSDPDNILKIHGMGINCAGDYQLLANSLKQILEDPEYYNICEKILKTSNMLFSTDVNIDKLAKIIESIPNGRR